MFPLSRSADLGKPVTPMPEPEPEARAEGASATQNPSRYARHGSELSSSDGRLAPAFSRFSESLKAELKADELIRRRSVREALGPTDDERLRLHRDLLAEQVQSKEITNAEANMLFEKAHPGIDPSTLKPRKS